MEEAPRGEEIFWYIDTFLSTPTQHNVGKEGQERDAEGSVGDGRSQEDRAAPARLGVVPAQDQRRARWPPNGHREETNPGDED